MVFLQRRACLVSNNLASDQYSIAESDRSDCSPASNSGEWLPITILATFHSFATAIIPSLVSRMFRCGAASSFPFFYFLSTDDAFLLSS